MAAEDVALAGRQAGKSLREIAVDLFGFAHVNAEWTPNGRMRAAVRRLVHRSRAAADGGPGDAGPGSP